jgi:hypothetical protein
VNTVAIAAGGGRFKNLNDFNAANGFGFSARVAKMKRGGLAVPDGGGRRDLAVEYRPIDGLFAYARNARTHSENQVAEIAASMAEFGWTVPVLVSSDGEIIAGHGRILAARKLGLTTVPTIVLDHLSDAQRRAYRVADNKLSLNAGWDEELLAGELHALNGGGFDLGLLGFDEAELGRLMAPLDDGGDDADGASDIDPDETPEALRAAVTRPGDLWLLGEHRLLCGDSTDEAFVARLIAGERCGRKVRAIELAPEYVDLTIARWRKLFPNASVTLDGDGRSLDEIASERGVTLELDPRVDHAA